MNNEITEINNEAEDVKKIPECMSEGDENPILIALAADKKANRCMKHLKEEIACRTCQIGLWIHRGTELVCYCPRVQSLTWQGSNPEKFEVYLCSGRQPRSEQSE